MCTVIVCECRKPFSELFLYVLANMDDKRAETSSDSDFGDSWTIIDRNSFCNRMADVINHLESENVFDHFSELSNMRFVKLNQSYAYYFYSCIVQVIIEHVLSYKIL